MGMSLLVIAHFALNCTIQVKVRKNNDAILSNGGYGS